MAALTLKIRLMVVRVLHVNLKLQTQLKMLLVQVKIVVQDQVPLSIPLQAPQPIVFSQPTET